MSTDWIKMRTNLRSDPRVGRLCDLTNSIESTVIGGLYTIWSMADEHTTDGVLGGMSLRQIDRQVGVAGFGQALADIGWIIVGDEGVTIEKFNEHNGSTAKARCQGARRQTKYKNGGGVAEHQGNADRVTEASAGRHQEQEQEQEQEQTKEKRMQGGAVAPTPAAPPPHPPADAGSDEPPAKPPAEKPNRSAPLRTFDAWRAHLAAIGEQAIPSDHISRTYAKTVGISGDLLYLHWLVFVRRYSGTGKRYRDWRRMFLDSLKGNYFKLWIIVDGEYRITTVGKQAEIEFKDELQ